MYPSCLFNTQIEVWNKWLTNTRMSGAQKEKWKPQMLQEYTIKMQFYSRKAKKRRFCAVFYPNSLFFFSDETEIASDEIKIISDKNWKNSDEILKT